MKLYFLSSIVFVLFVCKENSRFGVLKLQLKLWSLAENSFQSMYIEGLWKILLFAYLRALTEKVAIFLADKAMVPLDIFNISAAIKIYTGITIEKFHQ